MAYLSQKKTRFSGSISHNNKIKYKIKINYVHTTKYLKKKSFHTVMTFQILYYIILL